MISPETLMRCTFWLENHQPHFTESEPTIQKTMLLGIFKKIIELKVIATVASLF